MIQIHHSETTKGKDCKRKRWPQRRRRDKKWKKVGENGKVKVRQKRRRELAWLSEKRKKIRRKEGEEKRRCG